MATTVQESRHTTSLSRDLWDSIRHPEFWAYSTWLAIMCDYRRMRLGLIWALIPVIAYVFGLGFLYGQMMHASGSFYIYLGMGWALWRMTQGAIQESASVYKTHQSFILDGHTRYTDFILRAMARAVFNFFFAFVVVLVLVIIDPHIGWLDIATLIGTLPIYLFNLLWVTVVVSLLGARYPDIREFINTLMFFGFFFTPILWNTELVPANTVRGLVARLNPAFHFVEFVRAPMMGHAVEVTSFYVVAGMTVGGWLLAAILYRRYARYVPLWN